MEFKDLQGRFSEIQLDELAEILREFIAIERLLNQQHEGSGRDKFLREARICSATLRGPPWEISIDTLSEICDDTTQWLQSIDKWNESRK